MVFSFSLSDAANSCKVRFFKEHIYLSKQGQHSEISYQFGIYSLVVVQIILI